MQRWPNGQQGGGAAGRQPGEFDRFEGTIHVVDLATIDPSTEHFPGKDWLADRLARKLPLGFDLEWQPDRDKFSDNPVALMQFSDESTALLLRTHKSLNYLPVIVMKVLCSEVCHKIGVGFDGPDKTKMDNTFHFLPSGIEDLSDIARKKGLAETGLKLLAEHFGYKMRKESKVARSNWAAATLTKEQIAYAAEDAWMTYLLYYELEKLPDPVITNEEGCDTVNAGVIQLQPGWAEQGIVRRHDGLWCAMCDKGPMTVALVLERHMEGAKHKKKLANRAHVLGAALELTEDLIESGIYTSDGTNELKVGEFKCKICDAGPFASLVVAEQHLRSKRHLKKTAPPEPEPEKPDPHLLGQEAISEQLWNLPDYVTYVPPCTLICTLCDKKGDSSNAVKVMRAHLGQDRHAKKCRGAGHREIVNVEARERLEYMDTGRPVVRTGHKQPKNGSSGTTKEAHRLETAEGTTGTTTSPGELPAGWSEHLDPTSKETFYHNAATGESQWERPGANDLLPAPQQSPEQEAPQRQANPQEAATQAHRSSTEAREHTYTLPPGWRAIPMQGEAGTEQFYYADVQTHVSQWQPPVAYEHGDWRRLVDSTGRAYWQCSVPQQRTFYEDDAGWDRLEDEEATVYWCHKASGIRFYEDGVPASAHLPLSVLQVAGSAQPVSTVQPSTSEEQQTLHVAAAAHVRTAPVDPGGEAESPWWSGR